MPDARDVTFAVYHAGGAANGLTVANSCGVNVEDVDVPLSEAVDKGWLERFQDEEGNLAFRLTKEGLAFVESGTGEPEQN